jgi:hypothetical protein
MREANLMISLPPHPNVVQIFGVCIELKELNDPSL